MPLYLPILRSAWRIALRARRCWWFAIPAGFVIGSGFGAAIAQALHVSAPTTVTAIAGPWVGALAPASALWAQARASGLGASLALVAFMLLLTILVLAGIWVIVTFVNALIRTVGSLQQGEDSPWPILPAIRERWSPALIVHVVTQSVAFLILRGWGMIVASVGFIPSVGATLRMVIGFTVAVLALAAVSAVTPFALAGVVLDRLAPRAALREALALLRERWLILVEMSVLLTAANALALMTWIVGTALVALPFFFLGGVAVRAANGILVQGAVLAGLIASAAFSILLAIIFAVFLTAAWVGLYLRLTAPGAEEPEPWVTRAARRKRHTTSRTSSAYVR